MEVDEQSTVPVAAALPVAAITVVAGPRAGLGQVGTLRLASRGVAPCGRAISCARCWVTHAVTSGADWAKFGLLYLNDGVAGGKRILHPDWVDFCAAATLDTDYAAGFWTNRSEHPNARGRVRRGMPRDAFFASGDLGQRIVIMPSQRLVVVRLGDSVDPTGDIGGLARLVKEVIAAVQ